MKKHLSRLFVHLTDVLPRFLREFLLRYPKIHFQGASKRNGKRIAIAFAFDQNYVNVSGVTIASLLANRGGYTYDVYALVTDDVSAQDQQRFISMMKKIDPESTITFFYAEEYFRDANLNGFSVANQRQVSVCTYFRFMLPNLLPDLDRVIYADTDMIFCRDLSGAYYADMGNNLVAAVMDGGAEIAGYPEFNAGFMVMNLTEIRKNNMVPEWMRLSSEYHVGKDQEILNKTCTGRVYFLSNLYNFVPRFHTKAISRGKKYYTGGDIVVIHYIFEKPWRIKGTIYAQHWRKYNYKI